MRAKPRPFSRVSTTLVELRRQPVEGEVVALEFQGVGALALGHGQGGIELGVVGGAQAQCPGVRVGDVAGPPLRRRLQLVQRGLRPLTACGPPAPHQAPRQGAGGLPVPVRDGPGHDGGTVAVGALQEALAAGGQVVGHDRRRAGEVVEVDDVEVRPHAGGQDAAVVQPDGPGRGAGQLLHDLAHLHAAAGAVTGPVGEGVGREAGVGDEADVGPAVAETEDGEGVGEHFAAGVEVPLGVVGERCVEEVAAVVLRQQVEQQRGRRRRRARPPAAARSSRAQARSRARRPAGRGGRSRSGRRRCRRPRRRRRPSSPCRRGAGPGTPGRATRGPARPTGNAALSA